MFTYSEESAIRLCGGLATILLAIVLLCFQLIWFLILPFCFKSVWRKYRWKGIFPCLLSYGILLKILQYKEYEHDNQRI